MTQGKKYYNHDYLSGVCRMQIINFSNIRGDFYGGLTAAIIALPLALAFGVISGLGAEAGLYGAIILGFFAAFLGGTPTQISGPTGPMTVVVAGSVALFAHNPNAVIATIFLAGVIQIAFGFAKIGSYVKFIPYPVVSGFMSGIGAIIIILQINPLLGSEPFSSPMQVIANLSGLSISIHALIISALTLAIVFLTPSKISSIVPAPLIALVVVTIISVIADLDVARIGSIPSGLPEFKLFSIDIALLNQILAAAITLAILASIDSLLTSLVADSLTKTKHDSNKELIGQGVGNSLCAFFGAIPGAGATMRTVVNIKSGATTHLSGMIHALTLLIITLFLAPLASQIPMALLSGILIKVGLDIIDYKMLRIIKKAPKQDTIVMALVFFLTVFVDLIMAVAAGVTIAALLITYRIAEQFKVKITSSNDENNDSSQMSSSSEHIRIIDIEGAFFFGSTSQMIDQVDSVMQTKCVIINVASVPFFDLSALFALEEIVLKFQDLNIPVILVIAPNKMQKFKDVELASVIKEENIVFDLDTASTLAHQYLKEQNV